MTSSSSIKFTWKLLCFLFNGFELESFPISTIEEILLLWAVLNSVKFYIKYRKQIINFFILINTLQHNTENCFHLRISKPEDFEDYFSSRKRYSLFCIIKLFKKETRLLLLLNTIFTSSSVSVSGNPRRPPSRSSLRFSLSSEICPVMA